MIRVALEAGIVYPRDRAMLLEPSRNLERTLILMAHAHGERLHPAMQQEARVRIEAAAKMVLRMRDALDQVRAPDHRARDDIGMAVQILGAAVQRKVEADFRGTKINRAGERIVDDRDEPVLRREIHR